MKLKIINLILILCFLTGVLYSQSPIWTIDEIIKFYPEQSQKIALPFIHQGKKIDITIYRIPQVKVKKAILTKTVESKRMVRNKIDSFSRHLDKTNCTLELPGLEAGAYLAQIEYDQKVFYKLYLVTSLRVLCKQYKNKAVLWAINPDSGISYPRWQLYVNDKKIKQNNDYFYQLSLDGRTTIMASYSNYYDIINLRPLPFEQQRSDFIKIIPEKQYYQMEDPLHFSVIMREYESGQYKSPISSALEIFIVNSKNEMILQKKVQDISGGMYHFHDLIDDKFKEGFYTIQSVWKGHKDVQNIFILEKPQYPTYFKITSEKQAYLHEEKITIKTRVFNPDGSLVENGGIRCEIWARRMDEEKYELFKTFRQILRKRVVSFRFRPDFLDKQHNYELKVIVKVRSNDGIVRGDYIKLGIIKSKLEVLINSDKNLYEIGSPVTLFYHLKLYDIQTKIENGEIILYRIKDLEKRTAREVVLRKDIIVQNKLNGQLTVDPQNDGLFEARITVKSKGGDSVSASAYFYIISYHYGMNHYKQFHHLMVVADKDEYSYSDIGKVLILLPFKDIWCHISLEHEEVFASYMVHADKNFLLFDFPIYEKYSPNVFFHLTFVHQGKIFSEAIQLNVPLITKVLNIESEISNRYSQAPSANRINFQSYNAWGHKTKSDIIATTLNKDYMELYNHQLYDFFRHWYPFNQNKVVTLDSYLTNTLPEPPSVPVSVSKTETKTNFTSWDFMSSWSLSHSCLNYSFMMTDVESSFFHIEYPKEPSRWVTLFQGFTSDSKTGLLLLNHMTEKGMNVRYLIPKFLTAKDEAFPSAIIQNYQSSQAKVKLLFNIITGKYQSRIDRDIHTQPDGIVQMEFFLKPFTDKTIKIKTRWASPQESDQEEFIVPVLPAQEMSHLKNDNLKVKRKYYYLKYYEKNGNYFSQPRSAGYTMKKNDDILVEITLEASEDINNIIVTDFLPAGCDFIIKEKYKYHLVNISPDLNYSIMNKLNQVLVKIPYLSKGEYHIYYIIRPFLRGEFYVPGIFITSMNRTIYATGEGIIVAIKNYRPLSPFVYVILLLSLSVILSIIFYGPRIKKFFKF
ncbi:MAG: hypothetical protein JW827_01925 [Spirochaetes bacterium]|nr:hypothetical protein [Spirochaetota bacterium]